MVATGRLKQTFCGTNNRVDSFAHSDFSSTLVVHHEVLLYSYNISAVCCVRYDQTRTDIYFWPTNTLVLYWWT